VKFRGIKFCLCRDSYEVGFCTDFSGNSAANCITVFPPNKTSAGVTIVGLLQFFFDTEMKTILFNYMLKNRSKKNKLCK
jgi:hypothetical protein